MILRRVHAMGIGRSGAEAGEEILEETRRMVPLLLRTGPGVYSHDIARTLTHVAAWTYSDIDTFSSVMYRRGLHGCDCAMLVTSNDPMLLDTSAVIVQSPGRKLTILSFRGTEPRNAIDWLSDVSAGMEAFVSGGKVHGGFHRSVRAIWPLLLSLLEASLNEHSICNEVERVQRRYMASCGALAPEERGAGASGPPQPTPIPGEAELGPALYITGHSLGGALATVAAAMLFAYADAGRITRPGFDVKSWLRGVYTFGQPMVGDATFTRLNEALGKKTFRHVYRRDVVARLPSRTMGPFVHMGQQLDSSDEGWVVGTRPLRQALTLGLSSVIGVAAWLTQEVFPLRTRLPFSWGDHSPLNYIRTSMEALPGSELD